jgi:hypothetical protein
MGRVEYTHTAEKFFGELRGDNAEYIRKIWTRRITALMSISL